MITAVKNPTKYNVGDRARAAQASLVAKRAESSAPKRYEQTANLTAHQALVEATKIIQEAAKVAESATNTGTTTDTTETSTQTSTPTVAELEKSREILEAAQKSILNIGSAAAIAALKAKLAAEKAKIIDTLSLGAELLSSSEHRKLFGQAFQSSWFEVFPGQTVAEGISSFFANQKAKGEYAKYETLKAKVLALHPEAEHLIGADNFQLETLLFEYPDTKDLLVDAGLVAFELAGGTIIRLGGRLVSKIPFKAVVNRGLNFAKSLLDEMTTVTQRVMRELNLVPEYAYVEGSESLIKNADEAVDFIGNMQNKIAELGTQAKQFFSEQIDDLGQSWNKVKAKFTGSGATTTPNGNPIQFTISKAKGTTVMDLGNRMQVKTVNKLRSTIEIAKDSKTLDIQYVFKNGTVNYPDVSMGNVILDQIQHVGGDVSKLKQIKLSTVVNADFHQAMKLKGKTGVIANFGQNSSLDGMVRKMLEKIGKELDSVQIGDLIPEGATKYDPHYDVIINLK